jgi:hypothetical protein
MHLRVACCGLGGSLQMHMSESVLIASLISTTDNSQNQQHTLDSVEKNGEKCDLYLLRFNLSPGREPVYDLPTVCPMVEPVLGKFLRRRHCLIMPGSPKRER